MYTHTSLLCASAKHARGFCPHYGREEEPVSCFGVKRVSFDISGPQVYEGLWFFDGEERALPQHLLPTLSFLLHFLPLSSL